MGRGIKRLYKEVAEVESQEWTGSLHFKGFYCCQDDEVPEGGSDEYSYSRSRSRIIRSSLSSPLGLRYDRGVLLVRFICARGTLHNLPPKNL